MSKIDTLTEQGFPSWIRSLVRPNKQTLQSFLLESLSGYFHPIQMEGRPISGFVLFDYLNESGLIENCLNLASGKALIALGPNLPTIHSGRVHLFGSVGTGTCNNFFVPVIQIIAGQTPLIIWDRLNGMIDPTYVAGTFRSFH